MARADLKKQAEKERIERPLTIMRTLAAVLCLAVVVGLWISQADEISVNSQSRQRIFFCFDFSCRGGDWNCMYRIDVGDHVKRQGTGLEHLRSLFIVTNKTPQSIPPRAAARLPQVQER